MQCSNNMKQMGLAIHNFASSNNSGLPDLLLNLNPDSQNINWYPFFYRLLPYIEQQNLFNLAVNQGAGWNNGVNSRYVKTYVCPSDPTQPASGSTNPDSWAPSSYAPNTYLFSGQVSGNTNGNCPYTLTTVSDGTSNTVAVVERFAYFQQYGFYNDWCYPAASGWWGGVQICAFGEWGAYLPEVNCKPANGGGGPPQYAHPYYPNSAHSSMNTLLLDGSVRGVTSSISSWSWQYALQPNDGQILDNTW